MLLDADPALHRRVGELEAENERLRQALARAEAVHRPAASLADLASRQAAEAASDGSPFPSHGAKRGEPSLAESLRAELGSDRSTWRETEALFRTLAESVPLLVWTARPDGYHDWFNQRWYDYLGVSRGQTNGQDWTRFLHPLDRVQLLPLWRRALETGEPYEAEYRYRRGSDGQYRWFLGRAAPVRDRQGRVVRWFGTLTDVHDGKVAQGDLRRLNASLEQEVAKRALERDRIYRLSLDILGVIGFDGRLRSVSPAWERITGRGEDQALSRPLIDFVHPDDRERTLAVFERLVRGEPTADFENRLEHQDGSHLWISWRVTPALDEQLLYAVGRDVTAEKIREEQLRQAQKMEAVGQLTGGVAHDFNNLLTIVIGNLGAVQRQLPPGDDSRLSRAVASAMRGAQRAVTLTQRLLAFSRRQSLQPKPIDANKLVSGMSDLLTRTLGEQISVETVLAAGLWRVEVDPNQLENALLNLAVNARDAMPEGGKLTIETANTRLDEAYAQQNGDVAPGQYVVISVTDTGTGMTKEVVRRVFEPFFTTKPSGRGTGLGLSQVYGFVKQSGGNVKIYSEPGEGTTVNIYLPRLMRSVEAEEAPDEPAPVLPGTPGATILVVEDDEEVRSYATETLRELGYRVLEARDGATALRLLDRQPSVDLLFTDIGLPGLNGPQLSDEARARRPGLKVLFTTGYAPNAVIHQGRLGPGMALLPKPFTYADLAAKVRGLLEETETRRVLVVEDDLLVSMVAVDALSDFGFMPEEAASGTEALAKMRGIGRRYDLVLVDIGLPDIPGNAVIAEIRALRPELPILVVSGHDAEELRAQFAADARIGVLPKPYGRPELRAAIASVGVEMATAAGT